MNDGMPQPGGVRAEDLSNGTVLLTLESDDGKPFILAESCILALEREISILEGHDSLRGVLIHAEHKSIFCAGADIDANGVVQFWGYAKPESDGTIVGAQVGCDTESIVANDVAPCTPSAGQSVF